MQWICWNLHIQLTVFYFTKLIFVLYVISVWKDSDSSHPEDTFCLRSLVNSHLVFISQVLSILSIVFVLLKCDITADNGNSCNGPSFLCIPSRSQKRNVGNLVWNHTLIFKRKQDVTNTRKAKSEKVAPIYSNIDQILIENRELHSYNQILTRYWLKTKIRIHQLKYCLKTKSRIRLVKYWANVKTWRRPGSHQSGHERGHNSRQLAKPQELLDIPRYRVSKSPFVRCKLS